MRNILFYFFILTAHAGMSQDKCDCNKNFKYLSKSIEENYIGFKDKTQGSNLQEYNSIKDKLNDSSFITNHFFACYSLLKGYLKWFHDPHLNIYIRKNDSTQNSLREYFSKFEADTSNGESHNLNSFEGLYVSEFNGYIINFQKRSSRYIGKVIRGDNVYWFPNQKKYVLYPSKRGPLGTLDYYKKDHTLSSDKLNYFFSKDMITILGTDVLKKISSLDEAKSVDFSLYRKPSFKDLSRLTNYLRLPSFDLEQKAYIDSIVTANMNLIRSKPFLIIDLRNNGGGFSSCFDTLMPFIYSKPMVSPPIVFRASPENASMRLLSYYRTDTLTEKYNKAKKLFNDHVGEYVEIVPYDTLKMDSVLQFPQKIVMLTDRGVYSSAEHLVFYGKKSDKVIVMGTNTGGAFNYLDVLENRKLLSPFFQYSCPTVKYENLPQIDYIGFAPDKKLNLVDYENWIDIARRYLEKSFRN